MDNSVQIPGLRRRRDHSAPLGCGVVYECRRGVRIPYRTAVEIHTPEGHVQGTIRNISAGGLFMDVEKAFCVGHQFELNFQFRYGKHSIRIQAQVVRKAREGVGLRLLP